MFARRFLTLFVLALFSTIVSPLLCAAPLDTRVPKDAIIYVGFAGTDALAPAYNQSNLKGIVDNAGITRYLTENLPKWINAAGPEDAPVINEIKDDVLLLLRHPVALYVGPVDWTNIDRPKPRFAIISEAGVDGDKIAASLNALIAKDPPPPEVNIQVVSANGVLTLSAGASNPADFAGGADAIINSAEYLHAFKTLEKKPAICVYFDMPNGIATVMDALAHGRRVPPGIAPGLTKLLDTLGVSGMTQIAYTGSFVEKDWSERAFLGTTGPRKGILNLVDSPPVAPDELAVVPQDAAAFSIGRFDLVKLMAEIRNTLPDIDTLIAAGDRGRSPQLTQNFDAILAQISAAVGFDIEKELINCIGDQFTVYRWSPEGAPQSFAIINKLRDAATFTQTLGKLEELVNARGGGRIRISKANVGDGIEVSSLQLPQFSVAWVIRGEYLYVSTEAAIGDAVAQIEKQRPNITTNQTYQAVRKLLGDHPASRIQYSEPAKLYPQLYTTAQTVLALVRIATRADIPPDLLPTPKVIAPYMTSGGSISWSDQEGFYMYSRTAFPGAALVSGQGNVVLPAVALGTAVMLPSLGRARELSNRSYDSASARGLVQSAIVWAADHNDKLPDHVARLIAANLVHPKQLVSKRTNTEPLDFNQEMQALAESNFDAFAKKVDEHNDFVYLGKDMPNDANATHILVFQKPRRELTDGIVIGYADGHVMFVRFAQLRSEFNSTNEYRKQKNLPEINVDELLKQAGH